MLSVIFFTIERIARSGRNRVLPFWGYSLWHILHVTWPPPGEFWHL